MPTNYLRRLLRRIPGSRWQREWESDLAIARYVRSELATLHLEMKVLSQELDRQLARLEVASCQP